MSIMVNQNGLYVSVSDILLPNGNAHEGVLAETVQIPRLCSFFFFHISIFIIPAVVCQEFLI